MKLSLLFILIVLTAAMPVFIVLSALGRYELRSQLGAGGMGEVYLALSEGQPEQYRPWPFTRRSSPGGTAGCLNRIDGWAEQW